MSAAGVNITSSWYNEVNDFGYAYDGSTEGIKPGAIGHFTQVVWAESQYAGFGRALDKSCTTAYVVGQYSPPGNVRLYDADGNLIGKYKQNVLPPTGSTELISDCH